MSNDQRGDGRRDAQARQRRTDRRVTKHQRPALARVRQVIERLLRDGTAVATDGAVESVFPVAVPAEEGEALREWVKREGATETVEIGLGYGISALYICEGLLMNGNPAARHVVLDPNQDSRFGNCGLQAIDEAGLAPLLEFYPEQSQIVLPRLLSQGRSFDLAFIDGNHRFDAVFVDLFYLGRLVRPGGVIFLDDYQLPGISRAVSFFLSNTGWRLEETSAPDGVHQWAVLRISAAADTRAYDYFVEF